MKVWKLLGVAGVAGVAATGVIIARDQRRRTQLSPDQVRKQLHQRYADLERGAPRGAPPDAPAASTAVPTKPGGRRKRKRR